MEKSDAPELGNEKAYLRSKLEGVKSHNQTQQTAAELGEKIPEKENGLNDQNMHDGDMKTCFFPHRHTKNKLVILGTLQKNAYLKRVK